MRVLIACEFSGVVRDAFRALGYDAWSCDLLESERPGPHVLGDVIPHLSDGWDLMVAHPPCTHLSSSGARWFPAKRTDGRQRDAIEFFMLMVNAPIAHVAVENPVGIMSTEFRSPDQIIQPYQFGHPESKATCLWLKALPLLKTTNDVYEAMMLLPVNIRNRVHNQFPSVNRWKVRSRTLYGVAHAMAEQWGNFVTNYKVV